MEELMQMADAVKDLAERHHSEKTRHLGEEDYTLLSDAAEMLRSAQNELWRNSILLQSYRVVIQDTGNRA